MKQHESMCHQKAMTIKCSRKWKLDRPTLRLQQSKKWVRLNKISKNVCDLLEQMRDMIKEIDQAIFKIVLRFSINN
jgi:hypothetical protein